MTSTFWQMHAHTQAAQQDCDSSCCPPPSTPSATKRSVDDWLAMPCSAPDCSIPKDPAAGCTDQCVVVTHHVDEKCDGECDAIPFEHCDMSCDGFDSNWHCEGDDCSMSFGQMNVSFVFAVPSLPVLTCTPPARSRHYRLTGTVTVTEALIIRRTSVTFSIRTRRTLHSTVRAHRATFRIATALRA